MLTQTENQNYTLTIIQDEYPENPRDWGNLCTMAIFHNRYNFGDKVHFYSGDFNSWDEMEKYIRKMDVLFCLPIYMYDHGGTSFSLEKFNCQWDSGQVGFIYVRKKEVREFFRCKNITKNIKDRAIRLAKLELEALEQYTNGDVWTYVIEDEDGDIIEDGSGFYGYSSAEQEGQARLETLNKNLKLGL